MEAKAQARFIRVTPQKSRRVVNEVRGKRVLEAADILRFAPQAVATDVRKVLLSAVANSRSRLRTPARPSTRPICSCSRHTWTRARP